MRYGIAGTGMMGQEHIRSLALVEGAEVAAVCDPDEGMRARAQAMTGARAFACHREMASAGICDAYVVAAPNDRHLDLLAGLIPEGKPILCEKPLATTAQDCREILEMARGGPPVWVAMEYRYMRPVQALLDKARRGEAGDLKMVSVREHRFPFLEKVGDWNRFSERTGGTLVEKCCHFWDLMRLIARSDPARVYASAAADVNHLGESYGGRTPDIIDNAYAIVDFENGMRGMLDLCMFAEGARWQEVITVTGSKARIEAFVPAPGRFRPGGEDLPGETVVSGRADKAEARETHHESPEILGSGDHHGSTYHQHKRFHDMARSGSGEPEVTLKDGLWSVLVGQAAERSAKTGRAVEIEGPR